jgi:hypothetical protein
MGIFADLGSGTFFGSVSMSAASNNSVVAMSLNAEALSALNNGSGLFAIGGAVTTLGTGVPEAVFNLTGLPLGQDVRQLVLEVQPTSVPEPATMLLLGTGLAGVGATTRKRRKARNTEEA